MARTNKGMFDMKEYVDLNNEKARAGLYGSHLDSKVISVKGDSYSTKVNEYKQVIYLDEWASLNALHDELGEMFQQLAPTKYQNWVECKAIVDYRKAMQLLGADNG